jgi:hypothetical protein
MAKSRHFHRSRKNWQLMEFFFMISFHYAQSKEYCTCPNVSCVQADQVKHDPIDRLDPIHSYWKYWKTWTTICSVWTVDNAAV